MKGRGHGKGRVRYEDLPEPYRLQVDRQGDGVRPAGARPEPKRRDPGPCLVAPAAGPRYERVRLSYHCLVHRLRDWENLYTKHVTDALVQCGVFPDDDPGHLPEAPRLTQTLIGRDEPERIVITVEELTDA